ncbi:hypothetical protein M9H77_06588 [Catharanthus roseus]|uniref:Uncharacterized protein n=1 Tax=Catharanthus roseus TaxID=4058 RepID=A0ACC0BSI6_CATRO|nr:hypothetical protein M9H77_06588 [Catharanthus roseus]
MNGVFFGDREEKVGSRVLPDRPTRRKSAIKRTEPDLNPPEFENEVVSNSLEREMVATPPPRQGSPTNKGHLGQIHNTVWEIGEEKSTKSDPQEEERKDCRTHVQRNVCDVQVTAEDAHRILGLPIGGTDIESLLVQEGANEGLENELNLMIGEDKMISIISLKIRILNLRTAGMEFQVKFISYVTAKFLCSTMKYAYRCYWVPVLCDIDHRSA